MNVRSIAVLVLLAGVGACRGARIPGSHSCAPEPAPVVCAPPPVRAAAPIVCAPPPVVQAARVPATVVWDERVSPQVDCNPVKTQHTLVVTVLDQFGSPMPGQRVEWILARSPTSVGDIVAVDDQYTDAAIAPIGNAHVGNGGNKIDNQYAVSVTNWETESIDAANNYPFTDAAGVRMPDLTIGAGQTWITMTSVYEGVTDIIAYVPAIKDGSRHKVFAKKIWADWAVRFPDSATNLLPNAAHAFTVNVHKASDGSGLAGTEVEAEILDGPEAAFDGGTKLAKALSGPDGNATFTLRNTAAGAGTNRVRFTARGKFQGTECPRSEIVKKEWQNVQLECRCAVSAPECNWNDPVDVTFTVDNKGSAETGEVTLVATPPPGLQPADGTQFPLSLGTIAPGASAQKTVRFTAVAEGAQTLPWSVTSAQGGGTSQCACQVNVLKGALAVVCRCEPGSVEVGSPMQITGTVTNTGKGTLRNVTITLDWPEGMTPGTQNTMSLPEMAAGREDSFVFSGTPTRPGKYASRVRVAAEGFPEVASTCECVAVQCSLEVSLICPGRIGFGEPGNFTVKVTNKGDGPANGCSVRVAHGSCLDGATKDFPLGTIAPGQTATYDWTANGLQNARCVVTAEATCPGCTARAECEVEVTGLPAIQSEMTDKDSAGVEKGIFKVGEEFIYVLDVQNDVATQSTPPLKVVFSLPPELEFVSGTADRGVTITGAAQGATSSEFRLDLNEKVRIEYRVRALAVPPGNLVKVVASIQRASDGVDLANETESTTIK